MNLILSLGQSYYLKQQRFSMVSLLARLHMLKCLRVSVFINASVSGCVCEWVC